MLPVIEPPSSIKAPVLASVDPGDRELSVHLDSMRLRETNPVPLLISHLVEMENLEAQRQSLYTVVTELYINALDHGIPGLDSSLKSDPAGLEAYFKARESHLKQLDSGYIVFDLSALQSGRRRSIFYCA